MERILGIDLGDRRVGVALSDGLNLTAQPVGTYEVKTLEDTLRRIALEARSAETRKVVLGLPINMDGTEGPRAAQARAVAARLTSEHGLDVALWDERLSTVEAERLLGKEARRRKGKSDVMAAQFILQGYLDAQTGGVRAEE